MVKIRNSWLTPVAIILTVNIPLIATLLIIDKLNLIGITAKALIDLMILFSSDKTISKLQLSFGKGLCLERNNQN